VSAGLHAGAGREGVHRHAKRGVLHEVPERDLLPPDVPAADEDGVLLFHGGRLGSGLPGTDLQASKLVGNPIAIRRDLHKKIAITIGFLKKAEF